MNDLILPSDEIELITFNTIQYLVSNIHSVQELVITLIVIKKARSYSFKFGNKNKEFLTLIKFIFHNSHLQYPLCKLFLQL